MSDLKNYIAVGFDPDSGEADFAVSGIVTNLSYESMNELRSMITVAIGVMEDMWRHTQEKKHPTGQVKP